MMGEFNNQGTQESNLEGAAYESFIFPLLDSLPNEEQTRSAEESFRW